jgi:hyperosmotically inducible protein
MRTKFVNLLLFVACLYLAGCAELHRGGVGAGDERRSFQQITDDAKITSRINTEYFKDEMIHTIRIDVDTHRGVVTLHGYADHQEEATRAINIALDTPGVTKVISNLVIKNQALSPRGVVYRKAPPKSGDSEPVAPQETDR